MDPYAQTVGKETKKDSERRILDSVYAGRAPSVVVPRERPDFLVKLEDDLPPFGVEIAELYSSESCARLKHIHNYVGELLGGGRFRHKDDKKELERAEVNIRSSDGELKAADVQCVLLHVPPVAICAQKAASIVRIKDRKLRGALDVITHVNLIICDRTNLLGHLEPAMFYSHYCTTELREAVFDTSFREIYFVTRLAGHWVYVPMKLLLTLAELFYFGAVIQTPEFADRTNLREDFMQHFALHLGTIAAGEVRLHSDGGETEVLYGDSGFVVDEEGSVGVHMYQDTLLPACETVRKGDQSGSVSALRDAMRRFSVANTFTAELAFPAGIRDSD